ncbi:MAG: glycoside hydrolase family 127 protein [Clostridia bacterium]|nr:glycoside hydrolase family 127 protein [Clostridia bacterium]
MYRNFRYGEITPTGWIKRQLVIQAKGLAGNLDKFWPDIKDSAWIGGDRDGWERVPYWLDGFVPLAYLLRDEDLINRAQRYLQAIMAQQKEDGWICPCKDDEREKYDVWALFLITKVLAEYGVYAEDDKALNAVKRAMENLYVRMKEGTTKIFHWGKFRWFEGLIALDILKEKYAEPWIGELALMIKAQGANYGDYTEKWKVPRFAWEIERHIVNLAMMLKAEAVCLPFTDEKYKDEAQRLYDILYKYNGTAVGLINGDECLAGVSPVAGTELCAVVEQMYSCEKLFALTGETKWADMLERIAFNALPAATTEDMWAHQYDQQANQMGCAHLPGKSPWMTNGAESNMFGLEVEYGCCTANFGQGWPKLAHNIFLKSEKGILAAIPMASKLETSVNGVKVTVEAKGDYPFSDSVKYVITAEKPVRFEFAVRVPGGLKAVENGKPTRKKFVKFDRVWKGKNTVEFNFTGEAKVMPRPRKMYYIERGSLVFSLPVEGEWKMYEFVRNGIERKFPYADYEVLPKGDWAFGFADFGLEFGFTKVDEIPFSEKHYPAYVKANLAPVEWGLLRGYLTVADRYPKHRMALGKAKRFTFIPYGCTKLRMTELPKIIK